MTASIPTLRTIVFSGVFASLFLIPAIAGAGADNEPAAEIDDGWRRTRDGWEHISTWHIPRADLPYEPLPASSQVSFWQSFDHHSLLHPALVALGLFLVGWAGLTLPSIVQNPVKPCLQVRYLLSE